MAFNSATYHMNKAQREAWGYLAEARRRRDLIASGEWPKSWAWQIESQAKMARISMAIFRSRRAIARSDSRSTVK